MTNSKLSPWLAGAGALFLVASPVLGDGDIVWPTYVQATHTTDAKLTCPELHQEIAHVDADIKLLDTARDQVETAMRTAFDIQRYTSSRSGGPSGTRGPSTDENKEEDFARARDDIVSSKKVAVARHAFLTNLLAICKDAPAPVSP
jgi:hypothetical protein